jgi:hypothetical protein
MRLHGSFIFIALVASMWPRASASAASAQEPLCTNPTPIELAGGMPQMTGVATGGTMIVLPPTATSVDGGAPTKFVFRLSGHGPIQLWAVGPGGRRITPRDVRDHGAFSFNPSSTSSVFEEWGSGWAFPTAGCWDIHAARDDVSGDVLMSVTIPRLTSVKAVIRDDGVSSRSARAGHADLHIRFSLIYPDAGLIPQTRIAFWEGGHRVRVVGWLLPTGGTDANPTFDTPLRFKLQAPAAILAVIRVRLGSQHIIQRMRFQVI